MVHIELFLCLKSCSKLRIINEISLQTERCHPAGWQPSQLFIGKQLAALCAGTGLGQTGTSTNENIYLELEQKLKCC